MINSGNKEILEVVDRFINNKNEFHRYKSWDNCYKYFQEKYFKEEHFSDDNIAALNLSFYLASWGMYRGSTFLLKHNHTINIEIVKILKKFYDNKKTKCIYQFETIVDIKEKIIEHYKSIDESYNATDTLITKILLGTLCNTPAYDRYFKIGLGKHNIVKTFNKNSFDKINSFYETNKSKFQNIEDYPRMKLLDMYFFQIGYEQNYKKGQG
ncbi:hypothetical protein AB4F11_06705 [Francisella philomiragia]